MPVEPSIEPCFPAEAVAPPTNRGVVVISSRMQVMYMNRYAVQVITSIQQGVAEGTVAPIIPAVVEDLCADLVKRLSTCTGRGNRILCANRHFPGNPERQILLRGFPLPDDDDKSRILIVLEEMTGHREEARGEAGEACCPGVAYGSESNSHRR